MTSSSVGLARGEPAALGVRVPPAKPSGVTTISASIADAPSTAGIVSITAAASGIAASSNSEAAANAESASELTVDEAAGSAAAAGPAAAEAAAGVEPVAASAAGPAAGARGRRPRPRRRARGGGRGPREKTRPPPPGRARRGGGEQARPRGREQDRPRRPPASGTRRRAPPPRAARAAARAPARRTGTPGEAPPPNRGARPSAHSLCDPPHHAHDAAKDLDLARADRLQRIVLGLQPHVIGLAEEPLDRRLLTYESDDDLTVGRRVLLADDHHVVGQDAGLDHRVAPHAQEVLAVLAACDLRDLHVLLDVLLR